MDLRITGKGLGTIHYVDVYGNRFRRRQRFLLNVLIFDLFGKGSNTIRTGNLHIHFFLLRYQQYIKQAQ